MAVPTTPTWLVFTILGLAVPSLILVQLILTDWFWLRIANLRKKLKKRVV